MPCDTCEIGLGCSFPSESQPGCRKSVRSDMVVMWGTGLSGNRTQA